MGMPQRSAPSVSTASSQTAASRSRSAPPRAGWLNATTWSVVQRDAHGRAVARALDDEARGHVDRAIDRRLTDGADEALGRDVDDDPDDVALLDVHLADHQLDRGGSRPSTRSCGTSRQGRSRGSRGSRRPRRAGSWARPTAGSARMRPPRGGRRPLAMARGTTSMPSTLAKVSGTSNAAFTPPAPSASPCTPCRPTRRPVTSTSMRAKPPGSTSSSLGRTLGAQPLARHRAQRVDVDDAVAAVPQLGDERARRTDPDARAAARLAPHHLEPRATRAGDVAARGRSAPRHGREQRAAGERRLGTVREAIASRARATPVIAVAMVEGRGLVCISPCDTGRGSGLLR